MILRPHIVILVCFILASCASPNPTQIPQATFLPSATASPSPAATIDPDSRVKVGANGELLLSQNDMSVQWKNELGEITRIDQFKIVPGMEDELLLACQQAI